MVLNEKPQISLSMAFFFIFLGTHQQWSSIEINRFMIKKEKNTVMHVFGAI